MPGSQHPTPPQPWTAPRAQAALGKVAFQLLAAVDTLESIHAGLPLPADVDDRHEHRKPYDVATEISAMIEGVLENSLRPAIESLRRAAQVTDADLAADFERSRDALT